MRLRYVADRRTLVWALLLFPGVPFAGLFQPQHAPWLVPLALYTSYCSGVISHNHNHCPTFVGRRSNLLFGAWLSIFYGFPLFAWIPTHNQNHHRHLNGPLDLTATARHTSQNTLWAALTYPLACGRWQLPSVLLYARAAWAGNARRFRRIVLECAALLAGHCVFLAVALWVQGFAQGGLTYLLTLGAPALLAPYWMMLTNYLQHVDCDANSKHDHSRNFTSRFWNWFVFDNGYHTVHHEHPGLHWSRTRTMHESRATAIAPELNEGTLPGYVLRTSFARQLTAISRTGPAPRGSS